MKNILTLIVLVAMVSCNGRAVVSEEELKAYIVDPENGLIKTTSKGDVNINVIYRPSELVVAQQIDGVTDKAEIQRAHVDFDGLTYFVLKMDRNGQEIENKLVSDPERFGQVISHLSSRIASDIYVIGDKDTVYAVDAIYTRMFGSAAATSVMVVFDKSIKQNEGPLTFHLDDETLGLGHLNFKFLSSDIKKAPTLNLN
jgi:hypothetical protein